MSLRLKWGKWVRSRRRAQRKTQRVVGVAVREGKVVVFSMHNVTALSSMNGVWYPFESMPSDEVLGEAVLKCREASRTFVNQADIDQHQVDGEARFKRFLALFGLRSLKSYILGVHEFLLYFVEDGTLHSTFGKEPYSRGHRSSVKESAEIDPESAEEIGRFCKRLLERIEAEA